MANVRVIATIVYHCVPCGFWSWGKTAASYERIDRHLASHETHKSAHDGHWMPVCRAEMVA